jgi:capsular polysaccharide biosynthesis protein
MQLQDYVNVVLKRWWVIVIAGLTAAVAAYGFSKLQPSIFRATTSYLVDPSRNDNGLNIVLVNSMNSYRELLLSRRSLEQASRELQLDLPPERLAEDVYVQPQPDDRKMIIQVDHTDPGVAANIANKLGEILQAEVARLNAPKEGFDKISVVPLDPAIAPTGRHSPNTRLNVLAGGILGGIVGLLLAFVLYFIDDTVKTSGDVERFVGLTTLGAIPPIGDQVAKKRSLRPARAWLVLLVGLCAVGAFMASVAMIFRT